MVSGSLLSWNTVPAVSRICFLQRLHWNSLRVLSWQKPLWPQPRQVRPSRQRISNSAFRQASSLPNCSRNTLSLIPLSARCNPAAAILRLRPSPNPCKLYLRIGCVSRIIR
jgi:hypothetical protein